MVWLITANQWKPSKFNLRLCSFPKLQMSFFFFFFVFLILSHGLNVMSQNPCKKDHKHGFLIREVSASKSLNCCSRFLCKALIAAMPTAGL